jgi:Domain of unknown function (DUF397)
MDIAWTKSSRSFSNGNCAEVAQAGAQVLVRDSTDPDGPVLALTRDEWNAFLGGAKNGEFDALAGPGRGRLPVTTRSSACPACGAA